MLLTKLKTVVISTFLLGAAFFAARATIPQAAAQDATKPQVVLVLQEKPVDNKKPQPAPKAVGKGTLLLVCEEGVVAKPSDANMGDPLNPLKDSKLAGAARLSPDGTRAAFLVNITDTNRAREDGPFSIQVVIQKLDAPHGDRDLPDGC
jgi:hypothetical protein